MPVILMICFLITSILLFQLHVYLNSKQNVRQEENVLALEWLLRNGETKWLESTKHGFRDHSFSFPDGKVDVKVTLLHQNESYQIEFKAVNKEGKVRKHRVYAGNIEEIENETEEKREK